MTSVYSIVAFTPNKYGGQIRKGLQYNGAQGLNRGNSRSRFTKYCQTAMPKDRWETTAAKSFSFYFIWLVDNQLNNNPGTVAMYLTDRSNTKIFELQKVSGCGRKASWMIDHSLYKGTFSLHREHIMPCWSLNFSSTDGSLYLVSPVDPLYISLPILERARNKAGHQQHELHTLTWYWTMIYAD